MLNVLLLSSAMERLSTPMTFPLHAPTGVCRNLFGPVDHDKLNRDMKSKMREISYRDQQKWNFNFEAEVPLPGDYVWEETPVDTSPVSYQDSVQVGMARIVVTPVNVKPDVDVILLDSSSQDVSPHCDDRVTNSKSNTLCLTGQPGELRSEAELGEAYSQTSPVCSMQNNYYYDNDTCYSGPCPLWATSYSWREWRWRSNASAQSGHGPSTQ
uniref:Cyclin-dependent kinase inhibitor domain-containing protein n=1 Tax=Oncorhynchus tshawytscha TaxID=74940 RepID=A0A8C8K7V9_ONCTS